MKKNKPTMSAHKGYTLKRINQFIKIRDMRYKEFMSVAEIAKKFRVSRQHINQLLNKHYPLHNLIDVKKSLARKNLKYKLNVDDKVAVTLPVTAVIHKVSQKNGYTLMHNGVRYEFFGEDEVHKIKS